MKVKAKITWTATETEDEVLTEVLAQGSGADILAGLRHIFDEIAKCISKELDAPVEQARAVLLGVLKKEIQK